MAGEQPGTIDTSGLEGPPPSFSSAAPNVSQQAPALPSLNPADSPYQPLTLPEVQPRQAGQALPDQQPIQNLGAVNKAGAVAYMSDQILRGAIKGFDAARLHKADQFNKKLSALQTLDKQTTDQFTSSLNDLLSSGKTGPDGKPLTRAQIVGDPARNIPADPSLANDPQITDIRKLQHQGQAIHEATLNAMVSYMPQLAQDDGKGGSGGGGGKGKKGNLLQRMFGQNPDEALQAYYTASKQLGWRGQYAGYTDQQAQAAMQQRQGLAATQQAAAATAQNDATYQQALTDYTTALKSGDQARIQSTGQVFDELKKARAPITKTTPKLTNLRDLKTGQVVGVWDENDGAPPAGYALANTSGSAAPKVGSLGEFMTALYGPSPTPKQELEAKKLWTPEVQTVGTHTVMVWNGLQEVPVQVETTSTRGAGGPAATVPNVRADQGGQPVGAAPAAAPTVPTTATPAAGKSANPYRNPEDQPADVSHTFNKPWAKPGPYVTKLSPEDETEFRKWAAANLSQNELRNLDNPQTDYDTRGWWLAGKHGDPDAKLVRNEWDGKMHGNDKWKTPYNGTFSKESIYATSDAPHWEGEGKLITNDGRLVTDETPAAKPTNKKAQPAAAHPTAAPHAAPSKPTSNAGVIATGQPVGYKLSPETTTLLKNAASASTAFQASKSVFDEAKREAPVAKTANGGVARMNLLADFLKSLGSHTAGVSGSQVRLTNVEWQYAVQSAPLLQRLASHFSPTTQGDYTYLSGITLAPEQVDAIVMEMGRKALTAKQTWQDLQKQALAAQQADKPENLAPAPATSTIPVTHPELDKEILNLVTH